MIRGIELSQPPADGITDEDGETTGGVNIFPRPTRVPVTISRPPGNGNETPSNSGWPPKNYLGSGSFQKDRAGSFARQHSSMQDDSSFPSDEKEDGCFSNAKTEKLPYARAENRTLIIKNLSDRATHKDIVDIIRGGVVLDIFLRANERSASVSFVEGSAAQDFLNYTKRNDIYIHGKRVILPYQWEKKRLMFDSLNFLGMIANLFSQDMLQVRLGSAPRGTWQSGMYIQTLPMSVSGMILITFTTLWSSTLLFRVETHSSLSTRSIIPSLLEPV